MRCTDPYGVLVRRDRPVARRARGPPWDPGQRRRDCRVRNTGTEAVGGCCVATYAVLCSVNRHTTSPMRRTMSEGNQIWRDGSKLLSYRFDPGAYALEGIPSS